MKSLPSSIVFSMDDDLASLGFLFLIILLPIILFRLII
jgi:hypothetical protein